MVRNNKKGFTLVELLGVIVILLLLATIVTPIFVNYIKKSRNDVYDNQINTIKQSAKNWAAGKENIKFLPTKDGDCIEVTLERLKDNGYLDYNLKNPKTEQLFDDNMTVIIRKSGKDLVYEVNDEGNLTCDSGTIITSEYPKWVLTSSSPDVMSKNQTATVVITSDRKILAENLERKDITVKVGGKVIKDATVGINCTNGDLLVCSLTIANLSGNGKLGLTIEKETMQDEDGNYSKRQGFVTNTVVDGNGPKIVYVGRENTNSSSIYATKDDTVKIKFKVEKNNLTSNLTADDIAVYIDGNVVNSNKSLATDVKTSKIDFELTLKSINENGKLSIKIPSNKIIDNVGNGNLEKIISPGITYDNIKPVITYNPNERAVYYSNIDVLILASDSGSGIKENTLKYIFSKNQDATPNIQIKNKTIVSKNGEKGSWYLITKVCDLAGNCEDKKVSGIYNLSDEGPSITITPNGNSGYAKSADVTIKVESTGTELNESTFKYTIAESVDASVDQIFENNETIHISSLTGIYYVIAEACDEENNCTRKVSNQFSFDNEAPTIEYNPNGTNGYVKEQEVTLTVTDNTELDYTKYVLSVDKTATPLLSFNESIELNLSAENLTMPSPYYIITTACDKLGNCKTLPSLPYYIDYEAPIISVLVDELDADIAISDDVALAGYKITDSTTTPTSWEPISGLTYVFSHSETETVTKYIHAIDSVGNTSYEIMEFEKQSCNFPIGETWNFPYSGEVEAWTVPCDGIYKLEVWGAQGGGSEVYAGGKGGYSYGNASLTSGETIYIAVGGKGSTAGRGRSCGNDCGRKYANGGFNGGGNAVTEGDYTTGSGGGATHIGKVNNVLENTNDKDLYIVAGGGGGSSTDLGWSGGGTGGAGGGFAGKSGNGRQNIAAGGSQTPSTVSDPKIRNGSRGHGANYLIYNGCAKTPGGGSGYYGGSTVCNDPAGGGSGYLSDSLIANTSNTFDGTKTFVKPDSSSSSTETGHADNGYARITLVEFGSGQTIDDDTTDMEYTYTGKIKTYRAKKAGQYYVEVCGAQGADTAGGAKGGLGGKSTGTITLEENETLYIVVGSTSGYNGGGQGGHGGSGGGATHIAKSNGLLSSLSSNRTDVIIVGAGGGGGACYGSWCANGGAGGGLVGGTGSSGYNGGAGGSGGNTTTGAGYGFGQGGAGNLNSAYSGAVGDGGSGYYGGYGGTANGGQSAGGGGGSSYIGGVTGGNTTAGACSGDGYAKITYIES